MTIERDPIEPIKGSVWCSNVWARCAHRAHCSPNRNDTEYQIIIGRVKQLSFSILGDLEEQYINDLASSGLLIHTIGPWGWGTLLIPFLAHNKQAESLLFNVLGHTLEIQPMSAQATIHVSNIYPIQHPLFYHSCR